MRVALALMMAGLLTTTGCYQGAELDENVLEQMRISQQETQSALDTAVEALATMADRQGGTVHVEKIIVEGGTLVFALWPDGNHKIWGVADDGRTMSLAYERNGSSKTLPDAGADWIRK